ncbi:MAG TPA: LamG-like jellyroll fold domain-containing protein [Verrucomicrobiae bacterium]|nr:LamG-like jellyroll fold domain-containing protein [Verrucomicrobiae bacterium]
MGFNFVGALDAQDHTIVFSSGDSGVSVAITNWGLDTCWPSFDNMQRGLIYMGTNNVTIVRVGFFVDAPLTNNDVTPADKSNMQTDINLARMATAATKWDLNLDSSIDPWYQSGANTVYPDRWAAAMEACQKYYNRHFWAAEGFNEPDYSPNGEGSPQNLYDIFGYLQSSSNFNGTAMEGGSTLNDDVALSWFNAIAARASIGSIHCLAGSAANYVNFIQSVASSNAMPFNPELHNVVEAIIGANYGLKGGIWWGTAERARGDFVRACQGKRLGYADDLNNWTAAAVYRGPNGAVQAFLGGSERMATTTTYRFFSRDRDVFYDGYGPQRAYTVTVPGGNGYWVNQPDMEKVVDITWGADVQPPINGRYLIVNRNSHLVLTVPGGSTANGVQLIQSTYVGALYQQWDVNSLPSTFGGDCSYFTIKAAHDGVTMDLNAFSYANGDPIQQWNGGTNLVEQWYFQYAGNGYFKIRSRWSDKVIGVSGGSTSTGAPIVQWDDNGSPEEQWRLIPATVSTYDFVAPAAPTSVMATANAASVKLNWNNNTEPDLASYTVLRATNSGGPYDIVARGLTNNTFTDPSANQPENYYYVVRAVDRSLNVSDNSAQVSARPTLIPARIAHYSFESNGLDSSGNGNNCELVGSPAFAAGKYGLALSLNGSGQYAMVPAGIMAGVTNFTIAAWVYWNGGNAWQRIFDFGNDTTQYLFLTPLSGSGTLRFAISTNSYFAEQILETSPLPVGQWEHVAVTRNGNIAKLYTNGMLAASGTVTISPASFNPVLNNLGMSQYPADPFFNGRLDEVFIFNYALSDMEIARLAANQPPPPTTPTAVSVALSGKTLTLSWPSNYVGSRLLMQTNHFANGLSLNTNDWGAIPNSQLTNQVVLPIDPAWPLEFYRLVYP